MPRVLLLSAAYPPTAGGAETYASQLAGALSSHGWDVTVVTDGTRYAGQHRGDGVDVVRLTEYAAALSAKELLPWEQMYFSLLRELEKVVGRTHPDVVFSNGLETAILGRMLSDHLQIPLASNFHEHEPEQDPGGFGKLHLVYSRLRPDLVLAGSRMYEQRALRFGPADHVQLVRHGIDTAPFARAGRHREDTRRAWGVNSDARVLVCPGRFKQRKGQIDALRAFAQFASSDDVLIFVGSTSSGSEHYLDRLLEESSQLPRGRVVFDQGRGPADMPAAYGAADLVVLPSLSEGLGFTLLEAMASGVPTVATDIAGFREVVGDSGVVPLAPAADPDGLCRGIASTLESARDIRLDRAHRAQKLIEERFSLEAMGAATDALLRGLLGTNEAVS